MKSKSVCVFLFFCFFNGLLNPTNILSIKYILCYFFYSHNKDPPKKRRKSSNENTCVLYCAKKYKLRDLNNEQKKYETRRK